MVIYNQAMVSKADIRKVLLQQRLALSAGTLESASQAICKALQQVIEAHAVRSLHYYEPIRRLHEIDIIPFIDRISRLNNNLVVHTSRKFDSTWVTVNRTGSKVVAEPVYDCIIVPMLGFDVALHRIGYGGGYYDRLLSVQPTARKVGVCLQLGYRAILPQQLHDIAMDVILTETQIYRN